jgi:hypothetical protein
MPENPAAQHAIRDQLDSGYPAVDRIRKANAELRAALAPEGCSHHGPGSENSTPPVLTVDRITIPKPQIHTGPQHLTVDQATVSYLRDAAARVRRQRYWGSGVTALVSTVLDDVANAIEADRG